MTGIAGAHIPGYELAEPLFGHGGDVRAGRDVRRHRPVSIRLLPPFPDDSGLAAFLARADRARALSHPALLRLYDAGQSDGSPYLVSEPVDDPPLSRILAGGGALPSERVLRLLADAGHALQHLHDNGMVHGGLRPESIVLSADGTIRVADVGMPAPAGASRGTDVRALGAVAHAALTASLVARAALTRTESRGVHYRSDHPRPRSAWQRHLGLVRWRPESRRR